MAVAAMAWAWRNSSGGAHYSAARPGWDGRLERDQRAAPGALSANLPQRLNSPLACGIGALAAGDLDFLVGGLFSGMGAVFSVSIAESGMRDSPLSHASIRFLWTPSIVPMSVFQPRASPPGNRRAD